jgi:hypothetical protein
MARKPRKPSTVRTVDVYQKVRRMWTINPATKMSATQKGYKRSHVKRQVRKQMEKEEP